MIGATYIVNPSSPLWPGTRPSARGRVRAVLAEGCRLGNSSIEKAYVMHWPRPSARRPRSVPLVRQHGQRVKLSFLMQLLGLVRRGLPVNRAALDLAVVHLARLFGKSPPNIIGVFDEMFAQFLQLAAELALLRRHYGDRRGNIRLRRFRRRLRCRRLRRCRSLGHRRGHGRIAAPFRSRHPRRHDCLLDLSRIADRTADEPALDLTVVGRRVRKPALECVPLVARQRVADHSEPRIAWRGCAIGPIISNRRPCWSKRIFERAAVTSARSISHLPPFLAKT